MELALYQMLHLSLSVKIFRLETHLQVNVSYLVHEMYDSL